MKRYKSCCYSITHMIMNNIYLLSHILYQWILDNSKYTLAIDTKWYFTSLAIEEIHQLPNVEGLLDSLSVSYVFRLHG
jgi:hypothetical protein